MANFEWLPNIETNLIEASLIEANLIAANLIAAIPISATLIKGAPMIPVALVGHAHACPLHGPGTIVSGASTAAINGRPIARVGDRISCGAVIVSGSASATIEGQPVARQGDTTSHGGTLIEGDANWLSA